MKKLTGFVDMALSPKERTEEMMNGPGAPGPIYPYGLSISFTDEEMQKLDLGSDCEVGDMIEMECRAKVTSISKYDSTDGSHCRIELQIVGIATDEDEQEEPDPKPMGRMKSPYK